MLRGAVLYAKDLNDLTEFYTVLGGEVVEASEGEFAVLSYGETELTIVQAPERIASQIVIKKPPVARSETPLKPVFQVSSLEVSLNALTNCGGITPSGALQWTFRSNTIQDIVDPEGNVIQLCEPT